MSKRKQTPEYSSSATAARDKKCATAAGHYMLFDAAGSSQVLTPQRARATFAMQKSATAKLRQLSRQQRLARSQEIEERAVRRRFLAREREHERGIKAYWAVLKRKVRVQLRRGPGRTKGKQTRLKLVGMSHLPKYSGPVIDSKGRRGVFMSVEYIGARRGKFGVGRRLIAYITREEGVERDASGAAVIMSNVGKSPGEQAAAFELVEVLNRSARANGKLLFTMIVNLPDDVEVDARRRIVEEFCEEAFGAFDLPYCAALHEPSPEGDQRNKHAHIIFALRPLQRIGDHEWAAGRELRTDHDNPQRFGDYRRLFAQIMTDVVQDAGKRREYTHLSNAARGLKAPAQEHLGEAATRQVRAGEFVAKNARNLIRTQVGEQEMAEDRARRRRARGQARQAVYAAVNVDALPALAAPPHVVEPASLPTIGRGQRPGPFSRLPTIARVEPMVVQPPRLPPIVRALPAIAIPRSPPIVDGPDAVLAPLPLPPATTRPARVLMPKEPPIAIAGAKAPQVVSPHLPTCQGDGNQVFALSLPKVRNGTIVEEAALPATLPAIAGATSSVQISERLLELMNRIARSEEARNERRKRVKARRQQLPPNLGMER